MTCINILPFDDLELKEYVDQRYQYWSDKQEEVQAHYLEAFPALNKKKKNATQRNVTPDAGARFAAELQKEFYTTVNDCIT